MNAIIISAVWGIVMMFSGIFARDKKAIRTLAIAGLVLLLTANILDLQGHHFFPVHTANMLYFGTFGLLANSILFAATLLYFLLSARDIERVGVKAGETGDAGKGGVNVAEYFALIFFVLCGVSLVTTFNTLLMLFLGIEIISIPLYILTGSDKRNLKSNEASLKYFLMGAFSTGLMLLGIAFLYGASSEGSFFIDEVAAGRAPISPLFIVGLLLLLISMSFKVSAAPFHMWTPDVYQGAPLPVTAFMSVGTKAAAFAMIIRVFAGGLPHLAPEWQALLAFVAATSMVVGILMAIAQSSLIRLLAYSGVAQAGYILIGVIAGGKSGLSAVLYYLFVYMFMNFGAFAVITLLAGPDGDRDRFSDLEGLARRNPVMAVLMSVFMLSLAGFPPSVGFFGKLFLFTAGVSAGYTWLVVLAVVMSVVSVFYYVRVLLPLWSASPRTDRVPASISSQGVLWLTGIASVALGVYPTTVLLLGQLGANPISGP